jgi:hypothetical protein
MLENGESIKNTLFEIDKLVWDVIAEGHASLFVLMFCVRK